MSKFSKLRAIGHNIADSLASGMGFMIGLYAMDVYAEANASSEKYIEVDFLTGETSGGTVSQKFADAIKEYGLVLPSLCDRHGIKITDFRKLPARFSAQGAFKGFSVTTEDHQGRSAHRSFLGEPRQTRKGAGSFRENSAQVSDGSFWRKHAARLGV